MRHLAEIFEFTAEVLSPLHVGSGLGQLAAVDFFEDSEHVHLVDEREWARILYESGLIEQFTSYVCEKTSPSLSDFLARLDREAPHAASSLCKRAVLRSIPKGEAGLKVTGNLHVFATDPVAGGAYLPASSLKGAVRTALLFCLARSHPDAVRPIKGIALGSRVKEPGKGVDDLLRAELEQGRTRRGPHTDWLRGFKASDAYPGQTGCTEIREVRVVALDEKGGYRWGAKGARLFAEVVRPGTRFKGRLILAGEVWELLRRSAASTPSLDPSRWLELVAEKCRQLLAAEKEFFRRAGLKRVIEALEQIERSGANLRLGWGSGLLGASVLALHLSPEERRMLRKLYFQNRRHPEFPQSRKVMTENGKPFTTLGWVKITLKERR